MGRKRHTVEQIIGKLREVEVAIGSPRCSRAQWESVTGCGRAVQPLNRPFNRVLPVSRRRFSALWERFGEQVSAVAARHHAMMPSLQS